MEIIYACRNHNCSYPGKNRFEMTFDAETIMDDRNMATIFCPFCKNEMFPLTQNPSQAGNRPDAICN